MASVPWVFLLATERRALSKIVWRSVNSIPLFFHLRLKEFKLLDAVYARGCKFWDTSDAYEDNEELIGKWFAKTGKRKEIFLATKFGLADKTRFPNGDPDYVKVAFEDSLKKLQTDYVDLYYLHRFVFICQNFT